MLWLAHEHRLFPLLPILANVLSLTSCFSSPPNLKHDAGDATAAVDGRGRREGKMGTADVVDDTEPCNRDGPTKKGQERHQGSSEADVALRSIMAATQDSFKRQLADMRENLNKVGTCCCVWRVYATSFMGGKSIACVVHRSISHPIRQQKLVSKFKLSGPSHHRLF